MKYKRYDSNNIVYIFKDNTKQVNSDARKVFRKDNTLAIIKCAVGFNYYSSRYSIMNQKIKNITYYITTIKPGNMLHYVRG